MLLASDATSDVTATIVTAHTATGLFTAGTTGTGDHILLLLASVDTDTGLHCLGRASYLRSDAPQALYLLFYFKY